MRQNRLLTLLLLCPLATTLSQSPSIVPESHTVMAVPNARVLKLGTLRGSVYVVTGNDTAFDGTFEEQLVTHGDSMIHVRRGQTRVFGATLDTIIDRVPDLHPFLYSSHSERAGGTNHVVFHGNEYEQTGTSASGQSSSHSGVVPEGAWDMPTNALVVGASQLQSGVTLTFTVAYPGEDNAGGTIEAIVGNVEEARGQPCWKVTIVFNHQVIATEWVNEKTRRVARQVAPMDPTRTLVMEARDVSN